MKNERPYKYIILIVIMLVFNVKISCACALYTSHTYVLCNFGVCTRTLITAIFTIVSVEISSGALLL